MEKLERTVKVVDFRSRCFAFRRVCGEPPRRFATLGVSPVTLIPQDKEGFGSVTSHEENAIFIFEESCTFRFNQLFEKKRIKVLTKVTFHDDKEKMARRF